MQLPFFSSDGLRPWFCIALHVILVALHVCLFIVWARHYEHAVIVSLARSGLVSTFVGVTLQIFMMVQSRLPLRLITHGE